MMWLKLCDCLWFGVSVFVEGYDVVCMSLLCKEGNWFVGVFWSELFSGGVVIVGVGVWLDCCLYVEILVGDYLIVLLEICVVCVDFEILLLVFYGSWFCWLEF